MYFFSITVRVCTSFCCVCPNDDTRFAHFREQRKILVAFLCYYVLLKNVIGCENSHIIL